MTNFEELIKQRESCRDFNGKLVKTKDLLKCVEAARLAPSACNAQPWFFYIVNNPQKIKAIANHLQTFNQTAGAFIVIVEKKPSIPVKCINGFKLQDYTKVDIGIAASHICLQATELNLSTCMLGLFNEKEIKEELAISAKERIRLIISVGYSDNLNAKPKKRKGLQAISKLVE